MGFAMLATRTVDEMEAHLGGQLKRLNKNLDQKTLAARAGVSVRALRNREGGAGTTVKTLLSVVRALGRETWVDSVAPVATVNPPAMTSRTAQRQRAAKRRKLRPSPPAVRPAAAARTTPSAFAPDVSKSDSSKVDKQAEHLSPAPTDKPCQAWA